MKPFNNDFPALDIDADVVLNGDYRRTIYANRIVEVLGTRWSAQHGKTLYRCEDLATGEELTLCREQFKEALNAMEVLAWLA